MNHMDQLVILGVVLGHAMLVSLTNLGLVALVRRRGFKGEIRAHGYRFSVQVDGERTCGRDRA